MRYSIEGQELTDIADALRRKHGETRIDTIIVDKFIEDTVISKTPNATGFDTWEGNSPNQTFTDVVKIPTASSIKVKMAYKTNTALANYTSVFIAKGEYDTSNFPVDTDLALRYYDSDIDLTPSVVEVLFENTDVITFYYRATTSYNLLGYYAECYPLDADGNNIGGKTVQIKQEVEVNNTYSSDEMAQAIDDIIPAPTEEERTLKGNINHLFLGGRFIDWQDKVPFILTDITSAENAFNSCPKDKDLSNITITIKEFTENDRGLTAPYMFQNSSVNSLPKIKGKLCILSSYLFTGCNYLQDDKMREFLINPDVTLVWRGNNVSTNPGVSQMFSNCYSIRNVDDILLHIHQSFVDNPIIYSGALTDYYSQFCYNCYSLDELRNIPVFEFQNHGGNTYNVMSGMCGYCYRLKEFIFCTNNGVPFVKKWKSQTIDLSTQTGVAGGGVANLFNFNSGITADKEVKDDATYQALKDDPDWWTSNVAYSRYNHDSAVRTINSLPDTSAYGTNTIKFKGAAGSATDGGAINTLTEEEIAVAAAKGWTVTLVN